MRVKGLLLAVTVGLCHLFMISYSYAGTTHDTPHGATHDKTPDSKPVKRLISLSPHITELIYSAGAGDQIVGAIEYSDYPEAAKKLPRIGNYQAINIERILSLKPDLIMGWKNGNRPQDIERLQALGFNVWQTEINELTDIGELIRLIGQKTGHARQAHQKASQIADQLSSLEKQYADKAKLKTFYQVWHQPLMTINGSHYISKAMQICGAQNVFAELPLMVPEVSIESVIKTNPKVILLGGKAAFQQAWLDDWKKYDLIDAVQKQQLYKLDNNLFQRPTERLINALPKLCQVLDNARNQPASVNR